MSFAKLSPPKDGGRIRIHGDRWEVPSHPAIPWIAGDGIGPEVTQATRTVLTEAVARAYAGKRGLVWFEVYAGDRAKEKYGELLPPDTLQAIREFGVALKGPLTTPVGGGVRSLNVALRQELDLYANVRPVSWIPGVPSPMVHPENMNMVLFREATEDVYAGLEWPRGSSEALKLLRFLREELQVSIREDSGLGLKPISEFCTKRLVRRAIKFALAKGLTRVTLVHKGNIMKYTEGAFRDWGYELARAEFPESTVTEGELEVKYGGTLPPGKILLNDRIADNMLQQMLTRTKDYQVLALPNLNGDYLSDAASGQVGGLGVTYGGNLGDNAAIFEPVHGTAPKYAGKNKANPTAELLSGVMLLDHLGWGEAAVGVRNAIRAAIGSKTVTYDLARQMSGATEVGTQEFARVVIERFSFS